VFGLSDTSKGRAGLRRFTTCHVRTLQQLSDALLWDGTYYALDPSVHPIYEIQVGRLYKRSLGPVAWSNRALYPQNIHEFLRTLEDRDAAYLLLSTWRWPDRSRLHWMWVGPSARGDLPHPRPWIGLHPDHGSFIRAIGPRPHWIIVDPSTMRDYLDSLGLDPDQFMNERHLIHAQ
jgi:hypothetical protein